MNAFSAASWVLYNAKSLVFIDSASNDDLPDCRTCSLKSGAHTGSASAREAEMKAPGSGGRATGPW